MTTGFGYRTPLDIVESSPMRRRNFLKQAGVTAIVAATAGLGMLNGAVPALANIPFRTYMLGRLSVTVPEFMRPQVEKFSYTWDSRTPMNKSHYLAYPISLQEQPYADKAHAEVEWKAAIDVCRNNGVSIMFEMFELDVSNLFKIPAYFLCFKGNGATYHFYIIIQEQHCLLHIVGRKSYRPPAQPKKDALTEKILKIIANFYKRYRYGHNMRNGNVFYTYYGEIIDMKFNTDERMSIQFSNAKKDLIWGINTGINFSGETEKSLKDWMNRVGRQRFLRSRLRDIPNFSGKGYETLEKNKNTSVHFLELDYAGMYLDSHMPSFHMFSTKYPSADMDIFLEMWEFIILNIRPIQHENFRDPNIRSNDEEYLIY